MKKIRRRPGARYGRDQAGHNGPLLALWPPIHRQGGPIYTRLETQKEGTMHRRTWVGLSERERALLLDGLAALRRSDASKTKQIDAVTAKLVHSPAYPQITVGVHGGQVQWTLGSPFPIRVCDYDGDREELPDVDERGQHCRIWFEPVSNRPAS